MNTSPEPESKAHRVLRSPLPVKAVVIDLDGTILDTAPDLIDAAAAMTQELGLPIPDPERLKSYIGNGIVSLVKRVLTGKIDAEPPADLFARALPIFERYYRQWISRKSRPYPGAIEGLRAFQAKGLRLACVTNKAMRFTEPLLKETGLYDLFDLIIAGDTLPEKKPSPLPLQHTCAVFKIAPRELLMIGDSANDTQAARAAGCPVFCVPYGYNRGQPVEALEPDAVVASLAEAAEWVVKA
ncbi:MAG: phosphoglycolate phosphatase [Hydrogenophilus sp.]|nr:phosphoglycolate phosphatase [Hydrogenophilus sp.]